MAQDLTDLQLLHELEPVVEKNLNRHLSMRKDWNPHDYIPWSDGKNYYALGGQDWDPEQSRLSEVAQVSMLQNLLTEDNLPSYHREIAMNFGMDGPSVLAVAYPPLQFRLNCTVSETCAKSSPWMKGAFCELVTMQSSCATLSPTRLATMTVAPASLAADEASA